MFLTTSILSILISVTAIIFLLRMELNLGKTEFTYLSPIYILIFSFAFCDYMTSGLENPLSYLLTSFIVIYVVSRESAKKFAIYFYHSGVISVKSV